MGLVADADGIDDAEDLNVLGRAGHAASQKGLLCQRGPFMFAGRLEYRKAQSSPRAAGASKKLAAPLGLGEAVRARNGWQPILKWCAPSPVRRSPRPMTT